ncbi:MAG TPA: MBOAT family protein [Firmicutes bacterium]|nr:MBOAT family protein [Bacillota bacterium]
MLFSSITFLYYFLPCTGILYFAVPKRGRNMVLLAASLVFYGWGEPRFLIFMILAILGGYLSGRLIGACGQNRKAARAVLAVFSVLCLGMLAVCKYAGFLIENFNRITGLSVPLLRIALPIGISFYTFQILSYVIDVYRNTVPVQNSLISLGTYISMFPQLIAGPIVRYADLAQELEKRTCSFEEAAAGIRHFAAGLSKKVLLANTLGELAEFCRGSAGPTVLSAWIYAAAFTLQIYFDFSGYSDMAIGLGRIFGFHFRENFRYPYTASSMTDFWRRWHISLGTWFRDYLYIPLGGSRVPKARWIFNLLVVWAATGLWHGAAWNFVLWGLFYAALLAAEKLWLGKILEKRKIAAHIYVILAAVLGFVLFNAVSLAEAADTFRAMFGLAGLPGAGADSLYALRSYGPLLLTAALGATPLPARLWARLSVGRTGKMVCAAAEPAAAALLLLVCTAFLVDGSFNPFLYFRF